MPKRREKIQSLGERIRLMREQQHVAVQQLAEKTGGRAFFDLSRKDFPRAFSAIQEEVEHMYTVKYVPAVSGPPGRHHAVELRPAAHQRLKIRAPKGYYAMPPRP